MKNKILNSEILLPFLDYNKIESKKENAIKSIILVAIALTIGTAMFFYTKLLKEEVFNNFILDYIGAEINIISLLLSFSIAYLTILISSDNQNIKNLKTYSTDVNIDKDKVSLYQILLIQLTYTIYNEIVVLLLLLIHRFVFLLLNSLFNIVLFVVSIILLLNILYVIIKNVKNIYLSFWKNNF